MDSGWAAILGASIGLIGSSFFPWVREIISTRGEREREYREELRKAARSALAGISELFFAGKAFTPDQSVRLKDQTTHLSMIVRPEDSIISVLVDHTASVLIEQSKVTSSAAYQALAYVMPKWFRGELPSSKVERAYDATFEAAKVEALSEAKKKNDSLEN